MNKETVEKNSEAQTPEKTKQEIGPITKGSDVPGHTTQANQTTSTGSPRIPVTQHFLEKLGEMHDGEKRLVHALPLLQLAATSEDLKTLLGVHLDETKNHMTSLEELAHSSGEKLPDQTCQPIADLVKESVIELIKKIIHPEERDAAIIAAGRKVEQYEISAYTPLCAAADENDWTHERAVLASILSQEKLADILLAGLAEGKEPLQKLVEKASLAQAKSAAG